MSFMEQVEDDYVVRRSSRLNGKKSIDDMTTDKTPTEKQQQRKQQKPVPTQSTELDSDDTSSSESVDDTEEDDHILISDYTFVDFWLPTISITVGVALICRAILYCMETQELISQSQTGFIYMLTLLLMPFFGGWLSKILFNLFMGFTEDNIHSPIVKKEE